VDKSDEFLPHTLTSLKMGQQAFLCAAVLKIFVMFWCQL